MVVKRGDQWCVLHGSPQKPGSKTDKPKGTVIKCFRTRGEALKMHAAIMASKARRKEAMLSTDTLERQLREHATTTAGELSVDKEAGIVRNVRLMNKQSANGYSYSPPAIRNIAELAEGLKVFRDHADAPLRSVNDLAGIIRNPRADATGVTGDLQVNPKDAWIIDAAERMPDMMSLSIVADAKFKTRARKVVERVLRLPSADLVTRGATTKSLKEQKGGEHEMEYTDMTLAMLQENRPDLVAEIAQSQSQAEAVVAAHKAAVEELQEKVEAAEKERDALKEAATAVAQKEEILKLCRESKLGTEAVTDAFVSLLIDLGDATKVKEAIADREAIAASAGAGPSRRSTGGTPDKLDAAMVKEALLN